MPVVEQQLAFIQSPVFPETGSINSGRHTYPFIAPGVATLPSAGWRTVNGPGPSSPLDEHTRRYRKAEPALPHCERALTNFVTRLKHNGVDEDSTKTRGAEDVDGTRASNPVSIFISVDEWRDIATWMHASLDRTEHSPFGHFLLECEGSNRTWVTSDGAQITVVRGEGPPPRGLGDSSARFSVLVNSRFFRRNTPQDATLTVTTHDEGRLQTFETDGVEMTLPEHPGEFGDWRALIDAANGAPVEVDVGHLRDACLAASVVPFGIDTTDPVHTWLSIRGGRLRLESPWVNYPSTVIDLPLLTPAFDTVPALVDSGRLISLLAAIDFDRCTLQLPMHPTSPIGLRAGRYEAVLTPVDRWGRERELLEGLLCDFLGAESVEADADGDYPVTTPEGHQLWVRLHTGVSPISVQVFSVLATSVDPNPGLFEELNSINATAAHVKVLWASGSVMAEVDLVAETLDRSELTNALEVVRRTAERYRDVLSAYFGTASDDQATDAG